jgi:Na+-driven multidrug efflux pump
VLLGLFLPLGSKAIPIGEHINLLIAWTFVPMGISMVITSIVRANGAVVMPLVILVVSIILVRMSVGFGLYPHYGPDAIWWSFMASGAASALMGTGYYLHGGWRKGSSMAAIPALAE